MTAHSEPNRSGGGDKRERILDAAERVFAQHGFFAARVSEIAKEAGVADGTIYLYFKSKDELLISLFESRMDRFNATLAAAIPKDGRPTEKLLAAIRTYFRLVRDERLVAEVLTIELRQSAKFMKEASNPKFGDLLRMLAGFVAEGQQAGELTADVPAPIVARMIFGILDELALAWLLQRGEKFDIVRAADWVGALVTRGLENRRSTP
jgi:TetR/AcrR family transcriptional regulator, fatty acid metabolism regulator protein